jgi:pectinesterase
MSLWGQTTDDPAHGYLGTGVVCAEQQCTGFVEDAGQYMMLGKASADERFTYYAGAGWTRSGDFASAEEWTGYLDQVAARLRHPVTVVLRIKQDK